MRQKAKNITLLSIQVGYVKSEKEALTCLVLVCLFLNSHILCLDGGVGEEGGWASNNNQYGEALPKRIPLSIQDRTIARYFQLLTWTS